MSTRKPSTRPPGAAKPLRRLPLTSPHLWLRRHDHPWALPGVRLPARPGVLILSTILLIGLLSALASYETGKRTANAGFILPDEPSCSTLNNTSAQAPASDAEALGLPREFPNHSDNLAAPPILRVTATEPALEDCCYLQGQLFGDTPMLRTWKLIGLQTLLAGMLAGPALAEPPQETEKLAAIQKQLEQMKTGLEKLTTSVAFLDGLDRKLDDIAKAATLSSQKAQDDIAEVRKQLVALRSDFETLRNQTSEARVSRFAPSDVGPSAPTSSGRVELINSLTGEVTVVVNRQAYHLAPGEHRLSSPVPAGMFTYEVLGVTQQRTRPLVADQLFTVWVHPQP